MKKRSSVLFYFDNYHLISGLPDDQLALLFRSLMEFSEQEVNGGGASIATYQRRYPMGETAQAYFAFMADTVRRDAATYREKCANYSAAAQRREEQRRGSTPAPAEPRKEEPRQPARSTHSEPFRRTRTEPIRIGSDEYNREMARYARELMASPAPWERED